MVNPIGGPSPVGDNVADPGQAAGQSYNTGVTDLQNGDYASAYTNLLAASQDKVFSSQNPQVFYYMGLSAEYSGTSGLTPDAKECFKTYLQQPSTDPSLVASAKGQICMVDAQTALNSNDYETALKDYQQAGVDDPSLVTQLAGTIGQIKGQIDINKANAAQTANDVAGMLKWYQQAALDDPSMAPQLASTITQLTSQNQFNTDWPAIQNQINDAYTASSGNLMEGGGPQAAIDILQGVLDKYPEVKTYYPNIYLTMAQFAFQGSYVDQAKQYFADFAPTMASPDLDAQTMESAKYLGTQLYGNKLANWPNYVANLLGHTFGGDANLWNNFLINPLTGYMPQSEPKMFGGKRFNTEKAYNLDYGSDPLGHVNEQLHDVKEQLAGTSDPEGKAALEGMKGQLEQQIKQIQAAKNSPGTRIGSDGKELAPDDVKSSFRSFQNGEHYSKTISTNEDVKTPTGEVAEKGDVSGAGGPGFWGLGQTLAEYKTQEDEIGTINYQASGGQGLDAWSAQGSGSSAVMGMDSRAFDMLYGGATNMGAGVHFGGGVQARAGVLTGNYQIQDSEGQAEIGGQDFGPNTNGGLAGANAQASYMVLGAQGDIDGRAIIGSKGVDVGGSAGGFAGLASTSDMAGGSVLGQGVSIMGQAYAGMGAKLSGSFDCGDGKLGLSFGVGLGPLYIQPMVNINLTAAGQDFAAIYGTGDHSVTGMVSRAAELGVDAAAAFGNLTHHVATGVADTANSILTAGDNYFSNHGSVGGKIAEIALDEAKVSIAPILDAAKEVTGVASEVGSDIAKGKIGDAIEETVEGGAKAAWNGVKDLAKSAARGIKDFFSSW